MTLRKVALLAVLCQVLAGPASAGDEVVRRELELIYLFDGEKPEFLFVIGQSGFRTVDSLKRHLETWPPGSELRWAPGCLRLGGEPLLSSDEDMQSFRAFLESREIRLLLIPSG